MTNASETRAPLGTLRALLSILLAIAVLVAAQTLALLLGEVLLGAGVPGPACNVLTAVLYVLFALGGAALLYVMVVLPLWFRRPNPVIFVPVDFAAIGLYLLYINFATGGHWFLTFAFPVTGAIGLLVSGTVALLHYLRRGQLFVIGGALILGGGVTVLIEYLLNLTFHVGRVFFWSVYPLSAGVVLGVTLLVVGFCNPLRRSLHRKFFL